MVKVIRKKLPRKGQFQPGKVANPKGRGAAIPISKVMKEYTTTQVATTYTQLLEFSKKELEELIDHPETGSLKVVMAQAILRDMRNKEVHYTERIVSRIIGPIPQVSEIGGTGGQPLLPANVSILPVQAVSVAVAQTVVPNKEGQEAPSNIEPGTPC